MLDAAPIRREVAGVIEDGDDPDEWFDLDGD